MAESTQAPAQARPTDAQPSARTVTCPHCWHQFTSVATWAVSRNSAREQDRVVQDPRDTAVRFLPSRFALNGNPIDPMEHECVDFACPVCHLALSRANLVAEPIFTSVVGAPRAGKTFLLTAATWQLRATLQSLGCSFEHASPGENEVLEEYGRRLFQYKDRDAVIEDFGATDPSRPPNGVTVNIRGKHQRLLKPFQFNFLPSPELQRAGVLRRLLVLYDNPGQDYLARSADGLESSQHVKHSKVILLVINPLAERRLRDQCTPDHPLVKSPPDDELRLEGSQDLVVSEVMRRIRTLKGLRPGDPIGARIVVAITKSDLWPDMYSIIRDRSYLSTDSGRPLLARRVLDEVSMRARDVLFGVWPEFVAAMERADQSHRPKFFPVSVIDPTEGKASVDGDGRFALRGRCIQPKWAEIPFLWSLTRETGLRGAAAAPPS